MLIICTSEQNVGKNIFGKEFYIKEYKIKNISQMDRNDKIIGQTNNDDFSFTFKYYVFESEAYLDIFLKYADSQKPSNNQREISNSCVKQISSLINSIVSKFRIYQLNLLNIFTEIISVFDITNLPQHMCKSIVLNEHIITTGSANTNIYIYSYDENFIINNPNIDINIYINQLNNLQKIKFNNNVRWFNGNVNFIIKNVLLNKYNEINRFDMVKSIFGDFAGIDKCQFYVEDLKHLFIKENEMLLELMNLCEDKYKIQWDNRFQKYVFIGKDYIGELKLKDEEILDELKKYVLKDNSSEMVHLNDKYEEYIKNLKIDGLDIEIDEDGLDVLIVNVEDIYNVINKLFNKLSSVEYLCALHIELKERCKVDLSKLEFNLLKLNFSIVFSEHFDLIGNLNNDNSGPYIGFNVLNNIKDISSIKGSNFHFELTWKNNINEFISDMLSVIKKSDAIITLCFDENFSKFNVDHLGKLIKIINDGFGESKCILHIEINESYRCSKNKDNIIDIYSFVNAINEPLYSKKDKNDNMAKKRSILYRFEKDEDSEIIERLNEVQSKRGQLDEAIEYEPLYLKEDNNYNIANEGRILDQSENKSDGKILNEEDNKYNWLNGKSFIVICMIILCFILFFVVKNKFNNTEAVD